MAKKKQDTTQTTPETRSFDAEVGKVLSIMINSLYTNKDIFLRELISNASDACDKLRYAALTTPDLLGEDTELKLTVSYDEKAQTVTIKDNGIGMNRDDLIENLGTIARSGTQSFVEQLTGDKEHDVQLIGQFGVGFYSSFMVADDVTVISKKAGEEVAWQWNSKGDGEFTIAPFEEDAARGTTITLHLRDKMEEYLDKHRLQHIITTYSDHISLPVELVDENNEIEVVNSANALWTRPKSEITEEQYNEFYKHVSFLPGDPWMTLHNKVEGVVEFTNLLFIPSMKPFDLFHPDRKEQIKLYVKRVFINEGTLNIVPQWLRFLRGVVDSEDLPLNISRETLQHNALVNKISKSITKRVLSALSKKAKEDAEDYKGFWNNFGAVLKEGLCEAHASEVRDELLEVCRFQTTKSDDQLVSLEEYKNNMKEGQSAYYYLTGEDLESMKNSPQLEGFLSRDIEVLLLSDPVDEFWVNVVNEYKEIPFKSVTRSGAELDDVAKGDKQEQDNKDADKENDAAKADTAKMIEQFKTILGDKVKDVRESYRLTDSPVCLAVDDGAMDIRMERYLMEQKQLPQVSAKVLEVNPNHPIITHLSERLEADNDDADAKDTVALLFDQACIIEGEPVQDASAFSKRMNNFLNKTAR